MMDHMVAIMFQRTIMFICMTCEIVVWQMWQRCLCAGKESLLEKGNGYGDWREVTSFNFFA